jgi:hypothetical protein
MAKRKAARPTRRKGAASRGAARVSRASRRSATRQAATRKRTAKKAARASVRPAKPAKKTARKVAGNKSAVRKSAARKSAVRKLAARKSASASRKTTARRPVPVTAVKAKAPVAKPQTVARAAKPRSAPPAAAKPVVRTAPSLNRARRTIADEDVVPSPPSSLDLDRTASAVRSGRREMRERLGEHTETSPALTGGDVDADWESAYSVGDEAPGGDNPTPDQDIVDEIGHAIGVEYQDNEELKGEAKISKRDRNRWELDPASSDDWDER